jgi:hypothetical protein
MLACQSLQFLSEYTISGWAYGTVAAAAAGSSCGSCRNLSLRPILSLLKMPLPRLAAAPMFVKTAAADSSWHGPSLDCVIHIQPCYSVRHES